MKRRLRRFWLRYLHHCKEHWIIAGSIVLTALWLVWQIVTWLILPLAEIVAAFL